MKLLLHACCADCTIKFIESIKEDKNITQLVIYYYNPNIHPRSEYQTRLKAMLKICEEREIKIIVPDWSPKQYFAVLESKEYKKRCKDCWNLRIDNSIEYAKNNNFDLFSTTLISSEYQDCKYIEKIIDIKLENIEVKKYKPKLIDKKIETSGFYKQYFCGCIYSLVERTEEKYLNKN